MKIIGLTGKKRSGKDAAAQILIATGYTLVKFAEPLKEVIRGLLRYQGYCDDSIEDFVDGHRKEEPVPQLGMRSTRYAMQTLGTEWGRDIMSPTLWTNAFINRAKQFDRVVCTDVRFPNEAETIKTFGGDVYRIIRPGLESLDGHSSETLLDSLPVDTEIVNDSTIDELQRQLINLALK